MKIVFITLTPGFISFNEKHVLNIYWSHICTNRSWQKIIGVNIKGLLLLVKSNIVTWSQGYDHYFCYFYTLWRIKVGIFSEFWIKIGKIFLCFRHKWFLKFNTDIWVLFYNFCWSITVSLCLGICTTICPDRICSRDGQHM
jgi:hypothetical protein